MLISELQRAAASRDWGVGIGWIVGLFV